MILSSIAYLFAALKTAKHYKFGDEVVDHIDELIAAFSNEIAKA